MPSAVDSLPRHSSNRPLIVHPALEPLRGLTEELFPCVPAQPVLPQAAALELLESDPFWNVGLYKSVSLYRYPYSQDGEFNWQAKPYPYVALCMDKPGRSQLRKETRPRHLKYLSISQ